MSLLAELQSRGVRLTADGDRLRYQAPKGVLTRQLIQQLKTQKSAILQALDLETEAGNDWPDIKDNSTVLEAFANAIQTRRMREQGIVPPHYTEAVECAGCGPVYLWPGAGAPDGRVQGCPWCFNRVAGLPVPKRCPTKKQGNG